MHGRKIFIANLHLVSQWKETPTVSFIFDPCEANMFRSRLAGFTFCNCSNQTKK